MPYRPHRIAARALILHEDRLLLVNAYPAGKSDLWCAPGGGLNPGQSIPENLAREVMEETGLTIAVHAPAMVNEFHDPTTGFHQIDLFFRATITGGTLDPRWKDPEGIVTNRHFFSRDDLMLGRIRFKPDSLPAAAWGEVPLYDALERIVR